MAIKATIHLDGTVTYEEYEPEIIPETETEPTTDEILDALLGVTADE